MTCIIIDDIVDTAGTLCHAAQALKEKGAKKVVAYITHPVLSGKANENIADSDLDGGPHRSEGDRGALDDHTGKDGCHGGESEADEERNGDSSRSTKSS